jgi:putative membrane protein
VDPIGFGLAVAVFTLLGMATGVGTGLAPGLHVNNVAIFLLASRPMFEGCVLALFPSAGPDELVAVLSSFVMGVVIGHSFLDFVPSVYLGAPDDRTALSVLPGHRMLRVGEGHLAVRLAAKGALAGVLLSLLLLVPLRLVLGPPVDAYERAKGAIAVILLGIVTLLVLSERERRARGRRGGRRVVASRTRQRAIAALLVGASGVLGYVLLDTPWLAGWNWFPLGQQAADFGSLVLFPLFTGLFGFPTLLLSSGSESKVPPQDLSRPARVRRRGVVRGILSGSVAGALVSWLPGLSSGAATALAQLLSRGRREEPNPEVHEEFMVALGSVSTATSVFTVAVLFIIARARSGAAAAIQALSAGEVALWEPVGQPPTLLLVLVASSILAAAFAYPVTLLCSRLAARHIHRVRYDVIARAVLIALALLITVLAGAAGLMVAALATVLGLVPPLAGVKRVHLMGSLIVPVVLLYLGVV